MRVLTLKLDVVLIEAEFTTEQMCQPSIYHLASCYAKLQLL